MMANNENHSAFDQVCSSGSIEEFDFFIKRVKLSNEKRRNALKLMGSNCIINMEDVPSAVQYWKAALTVEETAKREKLENQYMNGPWSQYFNVTEFHTEKELDNVGLGLLALQIQAVVICERLLGSAHRMTFNGIIDIIQNYYSNEDYQSLINIYVQKLNILKDTFGVHSRTLFEDAILLASYFVYMVKNYRIAFIRFDHVVSLINILVANAEDASISYMMDVVAIFKIMLQLHKNSAQVTTMTECVKKAIKEITFKKGTLLHYAASYELSWKYDSDLPLSPYSSVLDLLLACGHEVNVFNDHKKTPLHLAATCQKLGLVQSLLSYGAHIDIKDVEGVEAGTLLKQVPGLDSIKECFTLNGN